MQNKKRTFIPLLIALLAGCAQQTTQQVAVPTVQPLPEKIVAVAAKSTPIQVTEQPGPSLSISLHHPKKSSQGDLWQRLRTGLELQEHYDNPGIEKQVAWYSNSQTYVDRVMQRGQFFLYHIITKLEANDMPLELAMLPAVESAFDPLAYSHSHASGLWQLFR